MSLGPGRTGCGDGLDRFSDRPTYTRQHRPDQLASKPEQLIGADGRDLERPAGEQRRTSADSTSFPASIVLEGTGFRPLQAWRRRPTRRGPKPLETRSSSGCVRRAAPAGLRSASTSWERSPNRTGLDSAGVCDLFFPPIRDMHRALTSRSGEACPSVRTTAGRLLSTQSLGLAWTRSDLIGFAQSWAVSTPTVGLRVQSGPA